MVAVYHTPYQFNVNKIFEDATAIKLNTKYLLPRIKVFSARVLKESKKEMVWGRIVLDSRK